MNITDEAIFDEQGVLSGDLYSIVGRGCDGDDKSIVAKCCDAGEMYWGCCWQGEGAWKKGVERLKKHVSECETCREALLVAELERL
jgi:hypothetical protein